MKKILKVALLLTGVMSSLVTFAAKADCGCTCDQVGVIPSCVQFGDQCFDLADPGCQP